MINYVSRLVISQVLIGSKHSKMWISTPTWPIAKSYKQLTTTISSYYAHRTRKEEKEEDTEKKKEETNWISARRRRENLQKCRSCKWEQKLTLSEHSLKFSFHYHQKSFLCKYDENKWYQVFQYVLFDCNRASWYIWQHFPEAKRSMGYNKYATDSS